MKKTLAYGTAVLALSVAPLLAQAGSTGSSSATGTNQTAGSQAGSTTRSSGSSAATSSADHSFVMEAARGGLAEVELGNLAKQKAQSEDVKKFADRMVQDHSKANDELKSLARTKNITLPTDLDSKDKATKDRLSKLSGSAFDRAYMQDMVTDHKKDVSDFRKESQSGKDPEVKAFASKTLPTLEEHLQLAQNASKAAVGTSGTSSEGNKTSGGTRGTTGTTPRSGSSSGTGSPTGSGSSAPR
jgi:putative membrane protein